VQIEDVKTKIKSVRLCMSRPSETTGLHSRLPWQLWREQTTPTTWVTASNRLVVTCHLTEHVRHSLRTRWAKAVCLSDISSALLGGGEGQLGWVFVLLCVWQNIQYNNWQVLYECHPASFFLFFLFSEKKFWANFGESCKICFFGY